MYYQSRFDLESMDDETKKITDRRACRRRWNNELANNI